MLLHQVFVRDNIDAEQFWPTHALEMFGEEPEYYLLLLAHSVLKLVKMYNMSFLLLLLFIKHTTANTSYNNNKYYKAVWLIKNYVLI